MRDAENEADPTGSQRGAVADTRWTAVITRGAAADGCFVYAVRTTGIYCRPSCSARTPKAQNVVFYATGAEAEATGFRPCRRCRPNEPSRAERQAQIVTQACRMIETAENPPSLDTLARLAGMSPFHFHRVFRSLTGITPKAYAAARRAERVAAGLQGSSSVTQALYAAGYDTPSRFYAAAPERLGMDAILVAATERGLCAILLGDEPDALLRDLQDRFPQAELIGGDVAFEAWVAQVVGFVDAPRRGLDLPLDIGGTAFQQRVWTALRAIPIGTTASYADIARAIGAPAAMRAVALACGANPLAVAIPCHRVVRSDGALSGYRWGVERKRTLLTREASPGAGEG